MLFDLLLFTLGAVCGSFANWAIYQLGYFRTRSISPLGPLDPQASPRHWTDRIPIVGWWFLRRDVALHGRGFWLRPLLIELAMAAGFVWLYRWQHAGGLMGGRVAPANWDAEFWFAGHMLLIWLLTVATFIDFDEKTIPDWITVPGVLAGLTIHVMAAGFRLPEVIPELGGMNYRSVTFASPGEIGEQIWHRDWRGLVAAVGIIAVWIYALAPKTIYWQRGWIFGLRIQWASIFRCGRRFQSASSLPPRRMFGVTRTLLGLGVVLVLGTLATGAIGGAIWDSYLGSLLGLAYTGGLVWAVRLAASWAMQQEAMGFGDVTLAAMIGSFVGWQAGLLVFAAAPFAALVIAIIQFTLTRNREIAFGPYLALATVIVVIGWYGAWEWARISVFSLGIWLHVILAACLVALAAMLLGVRLSRGVST
ncbi:MAG TPA: A24 family peptidase [Pirellulaceae bacterium]|nr:A24 family peptidase [Pirellulaceae bacterium]